MPEDRRVRKTKTAIKNAFIQLLEEKDLEKITIQNITQLADVNRGTFYLHYEDKYILPPMIQFVFPISFIIQCFSVYTDTPTMYFMISSLNQVMSLTNSFKVCNLFDCAPTKGICFGRQQTSQCKTSDALE